MLGRAVLGENGMVGQKQIEKEKGREESPAMVESKERRGIFGASVSRWLVLRHLRAWRRLQLPSSIRHVSTASSNRDNSDKLSSTPVPITMPLDA